MLQSRHRSSFSDVRARTNLALNSRTVSVWHGGIVTSPSPSISYRTKIILLLCIKYPRVIEKMTVHPAAPNNQAWIAGNRWRAFVASDVIITTPLQMCRRPAAAD